MLVQYICNFGSLWDTVKRKWRTLLMVMLGQCVNIFYLQQIGNSGKCPYDWYFSKYILFIFNYEVHLFGHKGKWNHKMLMNGWNWTTLYWLSSLIAEIQISLDLPYLWIIALNASVSVYGRAQKQKQRPWRRSCSSHFENPKAPVNLCIVYIR